MFTVIHARSTRRDAILMACDCAYSFQTLAQAKKEVATMPRGTPWRIVEVVACEDKVADVFIVSRGDGRLGYTFTSRKDCERDVRSLRRDRTRFGAPRAAVLPARLVV